MKRHQIAIDGPAASGKSTVARLVAERLGACYVNTGSMYRAVALACLRDGIDPETAPDAVAAGLSRWSIRSVPDGHGSTGIELDGQPVPPAELRTPEVSSLSSHVAKIPAVRTCLTQLQRNCRELGVIIMEGRDIGTVVFPDATIKFFVTASPEERARRRFAQTGEIPPGATLASVAADIARRDFEDAHRPIAPLKPADDAITIMTDGMTPDQVADQVILEYRRRTEAAP